MYVAVSGTGENTTTQISDTPVANPVPPQGQSVVFTVTTQPYRRGDLNDDQFFDILDVVMIINIAFRGTAMPPPAEPFVSDPNCDGVIDILDVIGLINTCFRGGLAPCP